MDRRTEHEKFLDTVKYLNAWLNAKKDTYSLDELSEISLRMDKKPEKAYKAWIGINPPPNTISLEELYTLGKQLPYKHFTMCVEQHTDGGIRPHLHILAIVSKTARANKEIPRLAKMFNVGENSIECKISNNENLNNQRYKYVIGEKREEKLKNVEKDKESRKELGIDDYYEN